MKSVVKYMAQNMLYAVGIYYIVLIALQVLNLIIGHFAQGTVTVVGDLTFISGTFAFVLGLVSFKSNFRFMQGNGVTRRDFWLGSLLSLVLIALCLTVLDTVYSMIWIPGETLGLTSILTQVVTGEASQHNAFSAMPLYFASLLLSAMAGYFITCMYYRLNKLGKWLVSLTPVYVFIIASFIAGRVQAGAVMGFAEGMVNFLRAIGLLSGNPLIMAIPFAVLAALFGALSYLFVRRAPAFR